MYSKSHDLIYNFTFICPTKIGTYMSSFEKLHLSEPETHHN